MAIEGGYLAFVDVKMYRENNKFQSSVYRKSKFTGLTNKFCSFISYICKINLIKTLFDKVCNISSFINLSNEFNFYWMLFLKSDFLCFAMERIFGKLSLKFQQIPCTK